MLSKYSIFTVLILGLIVACSEPPFFMDYRNFKGEWPASEKIVFVNILNHLENEAIRAIDQLDETKQFILSQKEIANAKGKKCLIFKDE